MTPEERSQRLRDLARVEPPKPSVGRIVHYTSYGTPGGEYTSQCRAAIIAGVHPDGDTLDLCVLNPTGLFFNVCEHDPRDSIMSGEVPPAQGGTWHWPERL